MRPFAFFLILVYSVSAAPNWVPAKMADAFDRQQVDSATYEGILRAGYEITGCEVSDDFVKLTIRRGTLVGEFFEDMKASKCEFKKNRYHIVLKPVEQPFPWKEVVITAVLFLAAGIAAGAGIGK